jgi:hypothetical protein
MREINFYKSNLGACPVENFLDCLSPKQAKKMTWVMTLVEELEKIPEQYFKKLSHTKDIWEIRA